MKINKPIITAGAAAVVLIAATSAASQWLQRGPTLAKRIHVFELQGVEKFAQPRLYRNYPSAESTEMRWQK